MDQQKAVNPQRALTELLLWHTMTKKDLAVHLDVPKQVINGILFGGKATEHTQQKLFELYARFSYSHILEPYTDRSKSV